MQRRPWLIGGAVGLLYATVLALVVVARAGSVSTLIHLAPPHTDPAQTPAGVEVLTPDRSYDGEFFYRMAVSPFTTEHWVNGVRFDDPALRWSRIVYPTVAFVVSLGDDGRAPLALVLTNVAAIAAIGALGAALAARAGRPWFHGLVFLVLPGVTYALTGDLADAVGMAFVLGALLALWAGRILPATIALVLAALTRESTLMLALGLLVTAFLPEPDEPRAVWSSERRTLAVPAVAALFAFVVWQIVIRVVWGDAGAANSGTHNFGLPFQTYVEDPGLLVPRDGFAAVRLFILAGVAAIVGLTWWSRPDRDPDRRRLVVPLAITTVAAICLSEVIVDNFRNLGRSVTEGLVLCVVLALLSRRRIADLALVGAVGMGVVLVGWEVWSTVPA